MNACGIAHGLMLVAVLAPRQALANGVPFGLDQSFLFLLLGVIAAWLFIRSLARLRRGQQGTGGPRRVAWTFVLLALLQLAVAVVSLRAVWDVGTDHFGDGFRSQMRNDENALSELGRTTAILEAYYADMQRYPDALVLAPGKDRSGKESFFRRCSPAYRGMMLGEPVPPDIVMSYGKEGVRGYLLTVLHRKGRKEYRSRSDAFGEFEWRWTGKSGGSQDTTTWHREDGGREADGR